MRLIVTAQIGGQDVASQVTRENDIPNIVTTMAYQAMNLQRDDANALPDPIEPVRITIETWTPPAKGGKREG